MNLIYPTTCSSFFFVLIGKCIYLLINRDGYSSLFDSELWLQHPDSARKRNTQVNFRFAKGIIKRIAMASWQHLATLGSRLQLNRHFRFQALLTSVLKLETSCQKENCCQGHSHTSWLIGFCPRMHARAWSRAFCFDCFFHNSVNFWTISTFSGPKYMRRFKIRE
jgi:hypothetical protein